MRRLLALFAALTIAVSAAAFTPQPVAAVNRCGDQPYVVFYEHSNYGGTSLLVCNGENTSDLNTKPTVSGEYCSGPVIADDDWNNCISSARAYNWTTSTRLLCVYSSTLYGVFVWNHNADSDDWATLGSANDTASSIKWVNDTASPYTCPGQ